MNWQYSSQHTWQQFLRMLFSGSARAKETLEWLSNDIFGKVVQLKKGVTIDRDKTSINLNENMDSLVPASKISDLPTGWICGNGKRLHQDKDRSWRQYEHSGIRRISDHEVFL